MKHTKGPWTIGPEYPHGMVTIIRQDDTGTYRRIATANTTEAFSVDAEANAQLIAAAPELLESLRWAVAALGYHGIDSSTGELDRAKAAIAKAEGK